MASKFPGPLDPIDPSGRDFIMTIDQVAEYIQISKDTLYKWRTVGYGPPAAKLPHCLRYSKKLVDRWLLSCLDDWGTVA